MIKNSKTHLYFLLTLGLFLILAVLSFIKIPFSIKVPGQVLPVKEWLLTKSTAGNLIQTLINHQFNIIEDYSVMQIERGDFIHFQLHEKKYLDRKIGRGDTIGIFSSSELKRELARLKGELAVERSLLAYYLTGEKPSVVEEAKKQLEYASKNVEEQEKIYRRQNDLFNKGLISEQEFELAQSALELFRVEMGRARAQLAVVSSGAKESQIQYSQNRVQALQDEINTLNNRFQHFTIIAPISGKLVGTKLTDTILVALDTSSYVVKMAIKLQDLPEVYQGSTVEIRPSNSDVTEKSKLYNLGTAVNMINGRQVVYGLALIDSLKNPINLGNLVECKIIGNRISVLNYLFKQLSI
jgi:hypothetical protein